VYQMPEKCIIKIRVYTEGVRKYGGYYMKEVYKVVYKGI
jgi:hypothetical protein